MNNLDYWLLNLSVWIQQYTLRWVCVFRGHKLYNGHFCDRCLRVIPNE